MSISHLIHKQIIMFTNDSFIFQSETESSLSEPSRAEFTRSWAPLTPLDPMVVFVTACHVWIGSWL
jgi:hypothetical protein